MRAELDAMFPPETDSNSDILAPHPEGYPFPDIPGYKVEAVLGTGGMGVVFKARHLRLNRMVALKMALAGAYAGPRERERFQREAEAVAALRHPNVIQVHDVGDFDGKPYFTMEYVECGSLAEKLAGTPLPAPDAAALVATLAAAVHAAHSGGIVHRDLKPGNVLLTADGTPKVSDFGLARRLDGEAGLTGTGIGLGTPSYMAPEQARGTAGAVGPPADIYALGAVLYETLTGRPPFRAESGAETVHQLLTLDPVAPSRLNGKVPRDLETICLKCLNKEPGRRYATAAALHDDLTRFLRGDAISVRPEGRMRRVVRAVRRRPTLAVGVAATTLLTILALAVGSWLLSERAVVDQAVADDLKEIDSLLQRSSFVEDKVVIQRTYDRLGTRELPARREQLGQRVRDCELADRLERIYSDWVVTSDGKMNPNDTDERFDTALREFGLGQYGDDRAVVAARICRSRVRVALLTALDRWSSVAKTPDRVAWVLTVAGQVEPVVTPWRKDARDPKLRRDRTALYDLIERANAEDESAALLLALSSSLTTINDRPPDPSGLGDYKRSLFRDSAKQIPFLTRVRQAHPDDVWANFYLGLVLLLGDRPEEAARCFQSVIALQPRSMVGYHHLGLALSPLASTSFPERYDEAVLQFRTALKFEPSSAKTHEYLVVTLGASKRHAEAIAHAEMALRSGHQGARLRAELGYNLAATDKVEEGLAQLLLATSLDPHDRFVRDRYREVLKQKRPWGELRAAWAKVLEGDRPNHADWYGYAELCLFLGREDEYRSARTALLARFGTTDSPQDAERIARACLLLPADGDEVSRAVALAELAGRADPQQAGTLYPYYQFVRGLAEYRQGNFDRAVAIMRGDAAKMASPSPQLVLAMSQHQLGREAEARRTFALAMTTHEWQDGKRDLPEGWIRQVLRREAERMIVPNLAALLAGKEQPRDNDERLALIGVCRFENRLTTLARIYAEAFAVDPKLAESHRVNAARAATQAGCGHGIGAGGLGDAERTDWRARARKWLREELAARGAALARDFNKARDGVRQALTAWQTEPELAGIRDPAALEKLSPSEREDCRKLWDEVTTVLNSTSKPK
jgi:serine/threonine-protein kinase